MVYIEGEEPIINFKDFLVCLDEVQRCKGLKTLKSVSLIISQKDIGQMKPIGVPVLRIVVDNHADRDHLLRKWPKKHLSATR